MWPSITNFAPPRRGSVRAAATSVRLATASSVRVAEFDLEVHEHVEGGGLGGLVAFRVGADADAAGLAELDFLDEEVENVGRTEYGRSWAKAPESERARPETAAAASRKCRI